LRPRANKERSQIYDVCGFRKIEKQEAASIGIVSHLFQICSGEDRAAKDWLCSVSENLPYFSAKSRLPTHSDMLSKMS
jgi:hypothetical protein